MAKLYIAGYADIGSTTRGSIAIPLEPANEEQALDIGPSSLASAPFGKDIRLAKLSADTDCVIAIGDNPDATASARVLKAGVESIVAVSPGLKVAVMTSSSGLASGGVDGVSSILAILKAATDVDATQKRLDDIGGKITELNAAAQASVTASAQAKADRVDADDRLAKAKQAQDDIAAAQTDIESKRADLAATAKAQQATADAENAALAKRSSDLNVREADILQRSKTVDRGNTALSTRSDALDQREQELNDREAALTSAKTDYEGRLAKLKALTT